MQIGRYLVQGCDVWLNTPQKPMEASGTSGMKAAINGVVNFSILDGWWPEAYRGGNGYVIGGQDFQNQDEQNRYDAESLYKILETEIRPLFYKRNAENIPLEWCEVIKNSIKTVTPQFSARRMLKEYVQNAYLPSQAK